MIPHCFPPRLVRRFVSLSLFLVIHPFSLPAQMVPGTRAVGEVVALGLDRDHRSRDFSIQEIESTAPSNVLWPGDKVTLKFRVTNLTDKPLTADGAITVIQYGTRGKPGDIWEPEFFQIAEIDSIPFKVSE